jgi:membrane fusion protein, multidrug efflux system
MKKSIIFIALLLVSVSLALTSCKHKKTADEAQGTPITVVEAVIENVPLEYDSTGSISPLVNPVIRSQLAGTVKSLQVKLGQPVTKDQVVVTLVNTKQELKYEQAVAQLNTSKAKLDAAQMMRRSKAELVKSGVVSKLDYANAVANEKAAAEQVNIDQKNVELYQEELEHGIIRSPIDGHVEQIAISTGDYVSPGTALVKLVNNAALQAILPFPQQMAGQLQVGQTVHLFSPATPGKEYLGSVTSISPSINSNNRSIDVIVEFQSDNVWHAGASITGKVYSQRLYSVIMLPTEALVATANGDLVYVIQDKHAIAQPVTILFRSGDKVAIQSNIQDKQWVAVLGAQYLGNHSLVDIKAAIQ